MAVIAYILLVLYILCLTVISLFCLTQLYLTFLYLRTRMHREKTQGLSLKLPVPMVTIQLPVYNEKYVIERLIDQICQMDYPIESLEIQVLDDSDDETSEIAVCKVEEYRGVGFDIQHISRNERNGFKAGALGYGMRSAKGEFIAIFDADFLPRRDFLQETLPHFTDPDVGVVQTRWGHLNESYSLLTRLQAFFLNPHFSIEQKGRQSGRYFLQFNGTGGIWRRECIVDAGSWQADTLTEDLDLSYRAQLKGWKVSYLEALSSPAELPIEMNGLKSQQYRWMKGGAETAKKLLPMIWRSDFTLAEKWHATIHLCSSSIFPFIFLLGILSAPLAFLLDEIRFPLRFLAVFFTSLLAISAYYFVGNVLVQWQRKKIWQAVLAFVGLYPVFITLSMGLSLHNSLAVVKGLRGRPTEFIRTPKYNVMGRALQNQSKSYRSRAVPITTLLEGLCFLYFLFAILYGIHTGVLSFIAFHFLLMAGFGGIFALSLFHSLNARGK